MAEEILGISGHLDISDIVNAIKQLYDELGKIEGLSKDMSAKIQKAFQDVSNASEKEIEVKAKNALAVFSKAFEEAKNSADKNVAKIEATIQRLQTQLSNISVQRSETVVGTKTFDNLTTRMEALNTQIHNQQNLLTVARQQALTAAEGYETFLGQVASAGSAVEAFNATKSISTTITTGSAVAHGTVSAAVGVEAAAHVDNTEKIQNETKAVLENKSVKEQQAEAENKVNEAIESEIAIYDRLFDKINEGKLNNEEYSRSVQSIRERIAELRKEQLNVKEKLNVEQEKALTWDEQKGGVSLGDINVVNGLTQEYELLDKVIAALTGTLNEFEQTWDRAHSKAAAAQENVTQKVEETTKAEEALNAEAEKEPQGFKAQWSAVNELHSKIQSLTKELQQYESEYDKLAEKPGFDPQSKKAQELIDKINQLKKDIADTKKEMSDETGAGSFLAKFKNSVTDAMTGNGKFQESLGNMKTALGGLAAPFTAATGGAVAFTRALWAMAATPLGAVISAVVLGLKALHSWFTKNAEGQRAFAKITAFVGSLLSSITDIAVKIGGYLYHAFADPQGALNLFGKGLVGLVINPLKTLAKTLSGIGQIAKGAIDLIASGWDANKAFVAVEKIKAGMKDLKSAGGTLIDTFVSAAETGAGLIKGAWEIGSKGVKTLWEGNLGELGADMINKARQSANLVGREYDAQKKLSEAKRDEHLLDIEIAKEREKIYTLTGKEKDAQIEKVKNMLKEKYKPQIEAQETLLDIQRQRNKLHTVSLEQLAKEREAQGAVYALQAQAAASTRMLVRMQQANLRAMASTGKKDARQQQQIEDATARYDETIRKNSIAAAKANIDLERAITDARIAAMKDGEEKVLAEKNLEFQRELEQLEEQRAAAIEAERNRQKAEFEAREKVIKARGGNPKEWSEKEVNQTAIKAINSQFETIKKLAVERQQNDTLKEEALALREYLKEYGSYEEKRRAITEEYEQKIAEATTAGDKAKLRRQMEEASKSLDFEQFQKNINWERVFGDLDRYSTAALRELKKNLRDALDAKDITVENAKVLAEKINEVDDKIISRSDAWASFLPILRERKKLTEEAVTAEQEYQRAISRSVEAQGKVMKLQHQATGILRANGKEDSDVSVSGLKRLLSTLDPASDAFTELTKIVKELEAADKALASATEEAESAQRAKNAIDNQLKNFNTLKKAYENGKNAAGGDIQYGLQQLQELPELIDAIGLHDTEFGQGVEEFVSGTSNFASAIQKYQNGDFVGAATDAIKGIQDYGHLIERVGGFSFSGSNADEVNRTTERLISANERLADRISDYTNAIGNSAGLKAIEASESALEAQKELQENNMEILRAQMGYHSAHHSNEYYADNDEITKLYKEAQKRLQKINGIFGENSVKSLEDVYRIVSQDPTYLKTIKDYAPDLWEYLTTVGKYDKSEYWDKVVSQAGVVDEITEKINNNLTQTSFDNLRNNFLDTLTDMESSSEDFAKNFNDMMFKAMINSAVLNDEFNDWLKGWQADYAKAVAEKNTEALADLRKEAEKVRDEKIAQRDVLAASMNYTSNSSNADKSASALGLDKISYEQADQIQGQITALQIAMGQQIASDQVREQYLMDIDTQMLVLAPEVKNIGVDVKTMVELHRSSNSKLDAIILNTNPIGEMAEEVGRIRRAVENL